MEQKKKTAAKTAKTTTATRATGLPAGSGAPCTDEILSDVEIILTNAETAFAPCTVALSDTDRKGLIGAQVRNHGFIDVAFHSAEDNPQLVPPYFNLPKFRADHADFENKRRVYDLLKAFLDEATDSLLVATNEVYHDALKYYDALKSEARNMPGAAAERDKLADYFKRGSYKKEGDEPTGKQLERDIHALMHGTKDGKVVIENVTPHTAGGVHKVIDEIGGGHIAGKETIEGTEKE